MTNNNELSILTWLYKDSSTDLSSDVEFIKMSGGSDSIFIKLKVIGGVQNGVEEKNKIYINYKNSTEYTEFIDYKIPDNTWVHLAITISGISLKVYADGIEVFENPDIETIGNLTTLDSCYISDDKFEGRIFDLPVNDGCKKR